MAKVITGKWAGVTKRKTITRDGVSTPLLGFRMHCEAEIYLCVAWGDVATKIDKMNLAPDTKVSIEASKKGEQDEYTCWDLITGQPTAKYQSVEQTREERDSFAKWNESKGLRLVPILVRHVKVPCWKPVDECFEMNGTWLHKAEFCMDVLGPGIVLEAIRTASNNRTTYQNEIAKLFEQAIGSGKKTAPVVVDNFDYEFDEVNI